MIGAYKIIFSANNAIPFEEEDVQKLLDFMAASSKEELEQKTSKPKDTKKDAVVLEVSEALVRVFLSEEKWQDFIFEKALPSFSFESFFKDLFENIFDSKDFFLKMRTVRFFMKVFAGKRVSPSPLLFRYALSISTNFFIKKREIKVANAWLQQYLKEPPGDVDLCFQSLVDVFDPDFPDLEKEKKIFLELFRSRIKFLKDKKGTFNVAQNVRDKEESNITGMIGYCCNFFMGSTFFSKESLEYALKSMEERRESVEKSNSEEEKGSYYLTLGLVYKAQEKNDLAAEFFRKSASFGEWAGFSEESEMTLSLIESRPGFDGTANEEEKIKLIELRKRLMKGLVNLSKRFSSNSATPYEVRNFGILIGSMAKIYLYTQGGDIHLFEKIPLKTPTAYKVILIKKIQEGVSLEEAAQLLFDLAKQEEMAFEARYLLGMLFLNKNPKLARAFLSYGKNEQEQTSMLKNWIFYQEKF